MIEGKHDNQSNFIWETIKIYQIDNQLPFDHLEKTVMLIQCHIPLPWRSMRPISKHQKMLESDS